jgi:hypothetical protein
MVTKSRPVSDGERLSRSSGQAAARWFGKSARNNLRSQEVKALRLIPLRGTQPRPWRQKMLKKIFCILGERG